MGGIFTPVEQLFWPNSPGLWSLLWAVYSEIPLRGRRRRTTPLWICIWESISLNDPYHHRIWGTFLILTWSVFIEVLNHNVAVNCHLAPPFIYWDRRTENHTLQDRFAVPHLNSIIVPLAATRVVTGDLWPCHVSKLGNEDVIAGCRWGLGWHIAEAMRSDMMQEIFAEDTKTRSSNTGSASYEGQDNSVVNMIHHDGKRQPPATCEKL